MKIEELDFRVSALGECRIPSPLNLTHFTGDGDQVLYHSNIKDMEPYLNKPKDLPSFTMAGPSGKIYFDPSKLKCGIVTCGGLCPGLNDVIRAIVLSLYHHYGVKTIFGFRYGYEGLSSKHGHSPIELSLDLVEDIHQKGGTVLGSSRGPQDITDMVDTLERMNIGILFTIGGDGTLRGAQAISQEIAKRGLKISVIGIPKTIDNDISYIQQSFGFATAVSEARSAVYSAHMEAHGARNGVGLVKLMGRESGFIAAWATLTNSEVNFCLIPEVTFSMEGFLYALRDRLQNRGHAVIVVGEGAGQKLVGRSKEQDASGNIKLVDIGVYLKERIRLYFNENGIEMSLKYIDPSYIIRSMPANTTDSGFCLLLGHNAVHAGMAGYTNMVVGFWRDEFTYLPISLAVSERKRIDPDGKLWRDVIASTGQPKKM